MKDQSAEQSIDLQRQRHLAGMVARGGALMLLGQVYVKVFTLVLQLVLSNLLGTRGYGLYSLGVNVIQWLRHFSQLGLQNGVLRFLPMYASDGKTEKVRGTIWGALLLASMASSAFGVGLWLFSPWLSMEFFKEATLVGVLRGLALTLPVVVPFWISLSMLRGIHAIGSMTASMVIRSSFQLTILIAFSLAGFKLAGAIVAFGVSAAFGLLFSLWRIQRAFPVFHGAVKWELRRLLRFSIPVLFTGMSYVAMTRLDLLLIGHFLPSESAALYRASIAAAALVQMPLMLVNTSFAPIVSQLFHKGALHELQGLYKTVTRWALLMASLACVIMITCGDGLLSLFGKDFWTALPTLRTLAIFQLLVVSLGSVGFMLQMTGHQDRAMIHAGASSACNLMLNLLLIPRWGILGAAVATGVSLMLNQGLNLFRIWRDFSIHPWDRRYLPILASLGCSLGAYLIGGLLGVQRQVQWLVPPLVYIAAAAAWAVQREDYLVLYHLAMQSRKKRR